MSLVASFARVHQWSTLLFACDRSRVGAFPRPRRRAIVRDLKGLCSRCTRLRAVPPIPPASPAPPVALRRHDSVAVGHGVRVLLFGRVAQRLASIDDHSEEVSCTVCRAKSRLQPDDWLLGSSGGATEWCAEAERSAAHRDRAVPEFFSTAAGAIFQIWGLKITFFFFFLSLQRNSGHYLGWCLGPIWHRGMYAGLRCMHPLFSMMIHMTCLIYIISVTGYPGIGIIWDYAYRVRKG